jgi:DNA repair protein RecN (Recombination protein N)
VIEDIRIRDLGVIADAHLPLGPGFTAITGETGAGKTMLVTALGLLLGDRGDATLIRTDTTKTVVEGRWTIPADGPLAARIRDAGGDLDPVSGTGDLTCGELLVSRTVTGDGRSRAVVGGRGTPVALLKEVGEQLVVVHGQSDQVRLKSPAAQREALDRFCGADLDGLLRDYRQTYHRWTANQGRLTRRTEAQVARNREADDLRHAISEITHLDPTPGEDVELSILANRLTNSADLRHAVHLAATALSADDDTPTVGALLAGARRALERAVGYDPDLGATLHAFTDLAATAADLHGDLASYLANLDEDGAMSLDAIQERRAALGTLTRKYGPSVDDVLTYLTTAQERLLELDADTSTLEELTAQIAADQALLGDLATQMTAIRTTHAGRLSAQVTTELAALAMANAKLHVQVTDAGQFTPTGRDEVQILLQANPGGPVRPLAKAASGGELSRVMLALEVVIAAVDPVPTFIFDEVDAGVGGAVALEIGRRLARLAQTTQVIAVTHLAQVAAFANNHLRVLKDATGSVTASSVEHLTGDVRAEEMARLLSGLAGSTSGLAHARELLGLAGS